MGKLHATLLLQNGQEILGNLQDNQRHGSGVVFGKAWIVPAAQAAVAVGVPEQFVTNGRIPLGPVLSACGPHGLGGIVMAIVVMAPLSVGFLDVRSVAKQVFEAGIDSRMRATWAFGIVWRPW